ADTTEEESNLKPVNSSPIQDGLHWLRPALPRINGVLLFRPQNSRKNLFLPARVVEIASGTVRLEWLCEPVLLELSQAPHGQFECTMEQWQNAANQRLNIAQVAPLKWPAGLVYWPREAPALIPASATTATLSAPRVTYTGTGVRVAWRDCIRQHAHGNHA
ncbi:hypothetical protein B0H17DRAFT_1139000, partial [Mycena rosella]